MKLSNSPLSQVLITALALTEGHRLTGNDLLTAMTRRRRRALSKVRSDELLQIITPEPVLLVGCRVLGRGLAVGRFSTFSMVEGKLSTADELSAIAAASGKVQTKRIAAYIKTTYLDAGITDKQAIFERLHVSFSSMQPQSDR